MAPWRVHSWARVLQPQTPPFSAIGPPSISPQPHRDGLRPGPSELSLSGCTRSPAWAPAGGAPASGEPAHPPSLAHVGCAPEEDQDQEEAEGLRPSQAEGPDGACLVEE